MSVWPGLIAWPDGGRPPFLLALIAALASACSGQTTPAAAGARGAPAPTTAGTTAAPQPGAPQSPASPALEPASPPAAKFREVTVPADTTLTVKLETPVASDKSQVEDTVRGTLAKPIVIAGETVVPAGAELAGTVTESSLEIVLEVCGRVVQRHVVLLEQRVHLKARLEPQHSSHLRVRQRARAIGLDGDRFE